MDRPVTVSLTIEEANDLAFAASNGNQESYVNHARVKETIARVEEATRAAEEREGETDG